MKRNLLILLVALVALLMVVGCKDSPDAKDEKGLTYEDLVGIWEKGAADSCTNDNPYVKFTFKDGQRWCSIYVQGDSGSNGYNRDVVLDNDVITFGLSGDCQYKIKLEGDEMKLTVVEGKNTFDSGINCSNLTLTKQEVN